MLSRRQLLKTGGAATICVAGKSLQAFAAPDISLAIAAYSLEVSSHRFIRTTAYNDQVPGPVLRMREGVPVTVSVANRTEHDEVVHWHGLFLPPEVDGSIEEGTPAISPGTTATYTFTPQPSGLRWYHTHTMADQDTKRGLYSGQFGALWIEPRQNPGRYDQEFFLTLHDWDARMMGSDDGSMSPVYSVSTINGRVLGFGEPLRVRQGQRVMMHIVNTSATEPHWLSLSGHSFKVVALDGNDVPTPRETAMLHLSPAERVSVEVRMNNPGIWVLGEVRRHVQAAGMGVVVEYAGSTGKPVWQQPQTLRWDYLDFASTLSEDKASSASLKVNVVPLAFESKFMGHGAMDRWMINGRSFPQTETLQMRRGERYRLVFMNKSIDDHPVHLHRHTFELRKIDGRETKGIRKDTVLVSAGKEAEVEFTAERTGLSLFHCHQQDHMDMGFMMLFRCS